MIPVDESLCNSLGISTEDLNLAADYASQEAEHILQIMDAKLFTR